MARLQPSTMLAYSAMKKTPKPMPAYSVNAPATSSLSASAMSKGARLVSASMQMKKMTNVTGMSGLTQTLKTFQCQNQPACWRTISLRSMVPVTISRVMATSSMGIS